MRTHAHARTHVRICAHARAPAQPECLQNTWIRYHHRVTHTRSRAGVHLLQFVYVHQGRFNHGVLASTCYARCSYISCICVTFLRVQIISKNIYHLFIKILDIIDYFLKKELGDFLKIVNYLYLYNKILFFINFFLM